MKKLFLCVCFLLLWTEVKGQNNPTYFDSPRRMSRDTVGVLTRLTRDFYFNPGNKSTQEFYNGGTIDLHIQQYMFGAGTATLTIEAYGIIIRKYATKAKPAGDDSSVTAYIDSSRIASFTVDSTLKVYALDGLFTTFKMFDGVRIVEKTSTADSVEVWSGLRTRFKWWDGR